MSEELEHSIEQELKKFSVCPKCNHVIEETYRYCPNCGLELNLSIIDEIILEQMIRVIDKSLYTRVDIQDMILHQFVVLNIKDGYLFVAVHENTAKNFVADLLQQYFDYTIKYVMLPTRRDLATLLLKCIIRVHESNA